MNNNHLFALGFNHTTIDHKQLSNISRQSNIAELFLSENPQYSFESLVFLQTCNRYEFYGSASDETISAFYEYLAPTKDLQGSAMHYLDNAAICHLFTTASGLGSQVVGDFEILGQFKKAFRAAKEQGTLSGYLERLGNVCLQASKEIRQDTKLSSGTTSLSYATVQVLEELSIPENASILLIGVGTFGKTIAKNLRTYFPNNPLTITNRTREKSLVAAEELTCMELPFEELVSQISNYDIIISAIDTSTLFFDAHSFVGSSPKTIMDLSVPSLFDEKLNELDGWNVYSIEQLTELINDALSQRTSSVPIAKNIMSKYIHEFIEWSKFYQKSDTIKQWKEVVHGVSEQCPHFSGLTEQQKHSALKKSVSRFALFVRETHERCNGNHIETFLGTQEETCILNCSTYNSQLSSEKCNQCHEHLP